MGLATKIFFPALCFGCGFPGDYLCQRCKRSRVGFNFQQECHVCRKAVFSKFIHNECRQYTYLDGVVVGTQFQGVIKQMVHDFKYGGVARLAPVLGDILIVSWRLRSVAGSEGAVVVPIPTTAFRRKWRGYNQAELLAQEVARGLGLHLQLGLTKQHGMQTQVGKSRSARLASQWQGMQLAAGFEWKGRSVILVDDVMTTGATLEAAAKALRMAGAARVYALVCARG
ncbi:MAG: ComF family protein [Candidatus Doudnabacteria bacterium]|nr:ComF family protein [Candidatus Doudnabacteria bacterium]